MKLPDREEIVGLLFFIFVMPLVLVWALLCWLLGIEWNEGGVDTRRGDTER